MFNRVVGPITCCLLFSWGVLAAPRKVDSPPAHYHPSTVGDKLVYKEDDGRRPMEWALEVTDVQQKGAALIVTLQGADGHKTPAFRYEVSDKGVCKLGEDDDVHEPPECFLRLPSKKGETWESTDDREGYRIKYTSAGEEEVEVPAGTFRCVRVDSECVYDGWTWIRSQWRAPRYGLVKEKEVAKDNEHARADFIRTTVLKSFTPGGR